MMAYDCKTENILAVLVLYERDIEQAESLITLKSLLSESINTRLVLKHILIYDNSERPHTLKLSDSTSNVTYVHNHHNGGTVAAYIEAIELAQKIAADWLLLLDQDTILPLNYLTSAANELNKTQVSRIDALIPYVKHGEEIISPTLLTKYGSMIPFTYGRNKNEFNVVTAISSGALLRRQSLKKIFPLPLGIWLDYVDHCIFLQFHKLGYQILVFDSVIEHDLSVKSPLNITEFRILSILHGEYIIIRMLGWYAILFYPVRFVGRLLKYSVKNPKLLIPMLKWVFSPSYFK